MAADNANANMNTNANMNANTNEPGHPMISIDMADSKSLFKYPPKPCSSKSTSQLLAGSRSYEYETVQDDEEEDQGDDEDEDLDIESRMQQQQIRQKNTKKNAGYFGKRESFWVVFENVCNI